MVIKELKFDSGEKFFFPGDLSEMATNPDYGKDFTGGKESVSLKKSMHF